jgi:hypothetical protein
VGLQKQDLDFGCRVIHVRLSAWYGRVRMLRSKANQAPVATADALVTLLTESRLTWKENLEDFLFLNLNGRPYSASRVVERGFTSLSCPLLNFSMWLEKLTYFASTPH